MKNIVKSITLGSLLILTGCVPSLHPLYTDQDVTFDPSLLGVWAEKDSKETWELTKAEGQQYKLIYTDEDGKKGQFIVHLLKVEGSTFLDMVPIRLALQQSEFYRDRFLPTHTFALISQVGPTVRISSLELEWLTQFLMKNPAALRHEKIDDGIVLTATPKELQKFLLTYLTEGAFSKPDTLERRKDAQ